MNSKIFPLAILILTISGIFSQSFAVSFFLLLSLALGGIMVFALCPVNINRKDLFDVYYISFCVFVFLTTIQWLGNDINTAFNVEENDQYRFWLASQSNGTASLSMIYKECIIDNIYIENGGYYFYLRAIAYFADHFFDGNHLLLQQLTSAVPGIYISIFLFFIISKLTSSERIKGYALSGILLTPLLTNSVGLHRDSLIAFLYVVIIYIWICKPLNAKNVIIQLLLAFLMISLREQHGFFAFSFVGLSLISSRSSSSRSLYVIAFLILFLALGSSIIVNVISNFQDTVTYYDDFRNKALSGVNSGLGRHIYSLPTPIKQVAQILVLQMQFPSWAPLASATNFYYVIMGLVILAVNVFWFYVFIYTVLSIRKFGLKGIPFIIKLALLVFIGFVILNCSNLDLRRVVCVYPLLFMAYVYYRENITDCFFNRNIKRNYTIAYLMLVAIYYGATILM